MSTKAAYRPDIDGLRAIAILSVVLYHAGIRRLGGGFVGVDIFFVISGFLIIGQIADGLKRQNFSIAAFWAKRALRILPPYLLVIGACVLAAPFILVLPSEFEQLRQQITYSALMTVNHLFLDQQGYFDTASELKPLLHLWSLAVEEQFYVLAPIAAVALVPLLRKRPLGRVAAVALVAVPFFASLIGSILFTGEE